MCGKGLLFTVAILLAELTNASSQTTPYPRPTWQDMLAKGIVPYRQLRVDDFRIDDKAHPKNNFYIRTVVSPQFRHFVKAHGSFYYATIDDLVIFSGFMKQETTRKSSFKEMKGSLPYAQALLDLNEIHARRLAALKTGELPEARGNTIEDAQANLRAKVNEFLDAKDKELKTEMEAFMKATDYDAKKKKVREMAAEIRKRLEATPATTVPFSIEPTPSPSPLIEAPSTPTPSF